MTSQNQLVVGPFQTWKLEEQNQRPVFTWPNYQNAYLVKKKEVIQITKGPAKFDIFLAIS